MTSSANKHAHRWTLRTGPQVVSSANEHTSNHRHEIRGVICGPAISVGDEHVHKMVSDNVEIESGPPISHGKAKKDMDEYGTGLGNKTAEALTDTGNMSKGILPDLVDPEHTYIFKTGEFGLYDYWYVDRASNYWRYSNAPEDSEYYDENLGVPVMAKDQPMPAENPQFFTFEGKKRHMAVPSDLLPEANESYSPISSRDIWYEVYERDGERRYIYLDSDIRENLDLWVQYQLRITDANIPSLRKFAVSKFNKPHIKDRVVAAVIMLMDQGLYELEELLNATVSDLEFIDNTAKLLGRKFVTDPAFQDFLTSLLAGRDPSAPLFMVPSVEGEGQLGVRYMASVLKYLKVSAAYMLSWNASYIYSKVINRLSFESVDPDKIDGHALSELKRTFGTQKDLQALIDTKLRTTLLENYTEGFNKSIVPRVDADEYGTLAVFSDLIGRRDDEIDFSTWLHAMPFHDLTPEEEAAVEEAISAEMEEADLEQEGGGDEQVDAEGNKQESDVADQEAGAVDSDVAKEGDL